MAAAALLVNEDFEPTELSETSNFSLFTDMTERVQVITGPLMPQNLIQMFQNLIQMLQWNATSLLGAFPNHSSTQPISNNPVMPIFASSLTSFLTTNGVSFLTTSGETTGSASFSTHNSTHSMDTDSRSSSTDTKKWTYSTISFRNDHYSIIASTLLDLKNVKRQQNSQGSHTDSKSSKTSAKLSMKLSPATTVVRMQGWINQLTDVLEKSMVLPSTYLHLYLYLKNSCQNVEQMPCSIYKQQTIIYS